MERNRVNGLAGAVDVGANAEAKARLAAFVAATELTGGPAAPCTVQLGGGNAVAWGGRSLADEAALAFVAGRAGAVSPEEAVAFGFAFVAARRAAAAKALAPKDADVHSDGTLG